jgi:thiamine-monophosphate kinase
MHILKQSQVDAQIELDKLPKSITLQKQDISIQNLFAACGGDDYELCFTAHPSQREKIQAISKALNLPLTLIGEILPREDAEVKIHLLDTAGEKLSDIESASFLKSFDHFA